MINISSGEKSPSTKRLVNDEALQKHLGVMSGKNPMKITSDTMLSNPARVAAFYLFEKDFSECTADEKAQVYHLMNNSEDQFDKLVTSHQRALNVKASRKKEVTAPATNEYIRQSPQEVVAAAKKHFAMG